MNPLAKYNKEQREQLSAAFKNNDVAAYKDIVGFDSMLYAEKITAMVFYNDMVDTFNSVQDGHVNKSNDIKAELSVEDKAILDKVRQVSSDAITNRIK